jgi:hypothetical protein
VAESDVKLARDRFTRNFDLELGLYAIRLQPSTRTMGATVGQRGVVGFVDLEGAFSMAFETVCGSFFPPGRPGIWIRHPLGEGGCLPLEAALERLDLSVFFLEFVAEAPNFFAQFVNFRSGALKFLFGSGSGSSFGFVGHDSCIGKRSMKK